MNLELGNDCFFRQKNPLEKSKENENDTPAIRDSRLGAEGQLDEGRLRRSCDLSIRRDQSSKVLKNKSTIRNNSAQVQNTKETFCQHGPQHKRLFTFHSCDLGNKGDSNGSMTTSGFRGPRNRPAYNIHWSMRKVSLTHWHRSHGTP